MPDENLEGTEDGHSNADSSFRVNGPDLPTSASPPILDCQKVLLTLTRKNPLPKASV
jgi:hypothetical protein